MNEAKKFYIKTFGCQMNVYDSARVAALLKKEGYDYVKDQKVADVVILNTCYIREKASEKIFSELGRIKKLKNKNENLIIAVIGCVAKAESKNIFKRAPYVDIVLSSQMYHKFPEALNFAYNKKKYLDVNLTGIEKFDNLPSVSNTDYSSYIAIQEGCDNFCTYCVVPYTRGREVSRPLEDVISEAKHLVKKGAVEIILTGQNVDSYHGLDSKGKEVNLARVIKEIAKFDEIKRIRYVTSYPTDVNDELIDLHKTEKKLMPFLYLPVQSGSDNVLKKMNRRYTKNEYLKIISKFKNARSNMQISSDFIVGFPGETEADFKETLSVVEAVGFIQSYSFKYSKRPGTPAAKMENQVPEKVKQKRLNILQELLNKKQEAFNKSCKGSVLPVLFTGFNKDKNEISGRSPYMQLVKASGSISDLGKVLDIKITKSNLRSLLGEKI